MSFHGTSVRRSKNCVTWEAGHELLCMSGTGWRGTLVKYTYLCSQSLMKSHSKYNSSSPTKLQSHNPSKRKVSLWKHEYHPPVKIPRVCLPASVWCVLARMEYSMCLISHEKSKVLWKKKLLLLYNNFYTLALQFRFIIMNIFMNSLNLLSPFMQCHVYIINDMNCTRWRILGFLCFVPAADVPRLCLCCVEQFQSLPIEVMHCSVWTALVTSIRCDSNQLNFYKNLKANTM